MTLAELLGIKEWDAGEHPRDARGKFSRTLGGIAADAPRRLTDAWGANTDGYLAGTNSVTGQPAVLWWEQGPDGTIRQYNSDPNGPDARCHYDTMAVGADGGLTYQNTVNNCAGAANEISYDPPIALMPGETNEPWVQEGSSAAVYREAGAVVRRGRNSWTSTVEPGSPTHVRTRQTTTWEDGSVTHWQEDYWLGEVPRRGGGSSPGIIRSSGGNLDVPADRWDITFDGWKEKEWNEDQPRDEDGRWSSDGGGGADSAKTTAVKEQYRFREDLPTGPGSDKWLEENPWTTTAWFRDPVPIDPEKGALLPGVKGEETYQSRNDPDIQAMAANMREGKFDPRLGPFAPITLEVQADGKLKIYEGNHRIRAAAEAGLKSYPADMKWLGGSERILTPNQFVERYVVTEEKEFDEDQPRDELGRWEAAGGGGVATHPMAGHASHLAKLLAEKGGFTYQPITHDSPHTGEALSIYPERERILEGAATVKDVRDYLEANRDFFADPTNYAGGWHDAESGKTYLDVSKVVPDEATANSLAREYKQEAYFDLGTGQTVYVHARGKSWGLRALPPRDDGRGDPARSRPDARADKADPLEGQLPLPPARYLSPRELAQIAESHMRAYTATLAAQLTRSTADSVMQAVIQARRDGTGSPGVLTSIQGLFSQARAKRVAITETTRLFGSGAMAAYSAQGIDTWEWSTCQDDFVCEICQEEEGKQHSLEDDPFEPAHVGCRCFPRPAERAAGPTDYERERESAFFTSLYPESLDKGDAPAPREVLAGWASDHGIDVRNPHNYLDSFSEMVTAEKVARSIADAREALRNTRNPFTALDHITWDMYSDFSGGSSVASTLRGRPDGPNTLVRVYVYDPCFSSDYESPSSRSMNSGQPFIDDVVARGWWPPGATVETILVHEMGHAAQYAAGFDYYWNWDDVSISTDRRRLRQLGVDDRLTLDDLGTEKQQEVSRKIKSIAGKVSGYAQSNPHEFVAETYTILIKGETVPADVLELYRLLGWPEPK